MRLKTKISLFFAAWLYCAANMFPQPVLEKLNVDVQLMDNGDALITETRTADVDDYGTEFYIVINNLDGMDVKNFSVSDESGSIYEFVGEWDVDRSRLDKTNKCGIVTKENGYELCWGLGKEGERVYIVSYMVTNLVKAYSDYDGFNYMFVARNVNPTPQVAEIKIHPQTDKTWTKEQVKMWAFGFEGDIEYLDGYVIARTMDKLGIDNSMIIMLQFDKGLFSIDDVSEDSFEVIKQRAFEGSDYLDEQKPRGFLERVKEEPGILVALSLGLVALLGLLFSWYKIWQLRKKANKDLLWYRELPYNGDLQKANEVLNVLTFGKNDYKKLVSAAALRLISIGALRIEEHFVEPTGFAKLVGKEGKNMRLITIGELNEVRNLKITPLLRLLYNLFRDASGDDLILQPKEFKRFLNSNTNRLKTFMETIMTKSSVKKCNEDIDNVRKLLGLKKFLKDFTLANERGVQELALWGDYLVYAELFGCADQVRKEMMQINPEFLKMDDMYNALFDDDLVHEVTALALLSVATGTSAINAERNSGGGGFSSIGGGGGFSGGGSGGGIR